MSTRRDFFLGSMLTTARPRPGGERMGTLIAFPLPPRYAVQPRPDAKPLQLRVGAAGRWPWLSDGDAAALRPPRSWRRFGSRLTPIDARGAGIWSRQNILRLQVGRSTTSPTKDQP